MRLSLYKRVSARDLHRGVSKSTGWWRAILPGVVSAFVHGLRLIAAVLIFTRAGADFLGVLQRAKSPPGPA